MPSPVLWNRPVAMGSLQQLLPRYHQQGGQEPKCWRGLPSSNQWLLRIHRPRSLMPLERCCAPSTMMSASSRHRLSQWLLPPGYHPVVPEDWRSSRSPPVPGPGHQLPW
uniref:Uncharacterized protein n=1 Tax=Romanomermis culicivorax TaxID=13658 RepID=A0A915KIL8_ROMCU